jgi:hypothetical protein
LRHTQHVFECRHAITSPPPAAEVQPNHYVERDANKQQLAYIYYESEPGRRSAAKLLSKDEARRIATTSRQAARAVAEAGKAQTAKPPAHGSNTARFAF